MTGPGRYDIQDFTENREKKPCTVRHVTAVRFKDFMKKQTTPGPGAYGNGGIPSWLLDERRRKPIGSCPRWTGMLPGAQSDQILVCALVPRTKDPTTSSLADEKSQSPSDILLPRKKQI
ncbi:uncharacterized protein ACWYII_019242 [Salvelinus alpinus]